LTFPDKRNNPLRVSEQESRVLITQWLERRGCYFSVETPTTQTYQQTGDRELSARTDITAYSSDFPLRRVLNIELKAGMPGVEEFRKDFEKLLREGAPGFWFHTLGTANDRTWRTFEEKVLAGLELAKAYITPMVPALHFAVCVLESRSLRQFDVEFTGDWRSQVKAGLGQTAVALPESLD